MFTEDIAATPLLPDGGLLPVLPTSPAPTRLLADPALSASPERTEFWRRRLADVLAYRETLR
jgi:O-succinylbenzoate synthase